MSGYARLLGVRQLEPGQTGWVQLRLARRIPVIKGDRFIIRQPSPSLTIGGGVIVDPLPRRRHRRFRPEVLNRLETLLVGTPDRDAAGRIRSARPSPGQNSAGRVRPAHRDRHGGPVRFTGKLATPSSFPRDSRSGFKPDLHERNQSLRAPVGPRCSVNLKPTWPTITAVFRLRLGMPRGELKSRLKLDTRLFNEAIRRGQQEGESGRHRNHRPPARPPG